MASLCKNCAGTLVFDPKINKLVCKTCGSSFDAADVKDYSEELLSDINTIRKRSISYYDANVYVCNHCGAEILLHGSESSTFCIYCGNPAIVFNRISKQIKPDGIIPFKVSREQALENIQNMFGSGAFLPSELKNFKIDKMRGIYIPYWIVDTEFHDSMAAETTQMNEVDDSTYGEYYGVTGRCTLKSVMCDASRNFSNDLSYRLEPFFLKDLADFDPDYLAGFYSDISDISLKELRQDVARRCDRMFTEKAMQNVPGFNRRIIGSRPSADLHDDPIYVMFPVWCLTYTFEGLPHTILVNGQTGKVVGTIPFDRKKIIGYIAMWTTIISALLLGGLYLALSSIFATSFAMFFSIGFPLFTIQWFNRTGTGVKDRVRNLRNNLKMTRSQGTADFIRKRTET